VSILINESGCMQSLEPGGRLGPGCSLEVSYAKAGAWRSLIGQGWSLEHLSLEIA